MGNFRIIALGRYFLCNLPNGDIPVITGTKDMFITLTLYFFLLESVMSEIDTSSEDDVEWKE